MRSRQSADALFAEVLSGLFSDFEIFQADAGYAVDF